MSLAFLLSLFDFFLPELLPRRGSRFEIPFLTLNLPEILFPTNRRIRIDRVRLGSVQVVPARAVQISALPSRHVARRRLGEYDARQTTQDHD